MRGKPSAGTLTLALLLLLAGGVLAVLQEGDQQGIIPRIIEDVFNCMESAPPSIEFTIRVSYVEIYLERICDLLNPEVRPPHIGGQARRAIKGEVVVWAGGERLGLRLLVHRFAASVW